MDMLVIPARVAKFLILSILVGSGLLVMIPIWIIIMLVHRLCRLPKDTIFVTILTAIISALLGLWFALALRK